MHGNWRKTFQCICILLITVWLSACEQNQPKPSELRLAVVNTPNDSGLLDYLLADFTLQTGIELNIHSSENPFARGRAGEADLILSHYGKVGMAEFVTDGLGSWPKMVFSNQAVLIGPADDPAQVSRHQNLADAFKAIAAHKQVLIANNTAGILRLTKLAAESAGQDLDDDWYQDRGVSKGRAIKMAEKEHAYVIWGAAPFLKFQQKHHSNMKIVLSADPLLHRMMAITRVSAEHYPNVNDAAAKHLETYLLSSEAQEKVIRFRMTGSDQQLWWPAARHN